MIPTYPNFGFAATNGARLNWARLCISREDLTNAAMWHEKLPRDVTWSHSHVRKLDNVSAHVIRKGPTIDENPTELVHTRLTWG